MSSLTFAQPDITLALDADGVIREAKLSNGIAGEFVSSWRGRPWHETIADDGGDKIRLIVEDARVSGIAAFRQVLQRFPSGLEIPIEYTTVRLDGRKGGLVAMGKNLQAVSELQSRLVATQQAREQEYWKLREVETRYRLLFDASSEAVLLVRAESLRVVEANPAAVRALGVAVDWEFLRHIDAQDHEPFLAMLGRVREQARAPGIVVHLGSSREPWAVRASLMASEPGLLYLLHLAPVGAAAPEAGSVLIGPSSSVSLDMLVERLPDGFAVVDADGVILRANQAFAELVQVGSVEAVLGERIGRWLSRPGSDFAVLLATVQRHRVVRLLSTTIHGELNSEIEVEVSAVGNSELRPKVFGLLIRDVGRRLAGPGEEDRLTAILRAATGQIGRTPLLKVVRDTVDAVEQHYIRGALDLAAGNRTAAAELLGLSRQSLHTKLNRYGLDGAGGGDSDQNE
jgi:transcriptional regulator PpsR